MEERHFSKMEEGGSKPLSSRIITKEVLDIFSKEYK